MRAVHLYIATVVIQSMPPISSIVCETVGEFRGETRLPRCRTEIVLELPRKDIFAPVIVLVGDLLSRNVAFSDVYPMPQAVFWPSKRTQNSLLFKSDARPPVHAYACHFTDRAPPGLTMRHYKAARCVLELSET